MLLAFGDSHRNPQALEKICDIIKQEKPDLFVHTGDNFADFQRLLRRTKINGYGVRGNCDSPFIVGAPEELFFDYRGVKIFLTHGHNYGAKYTQEQLLKRAEEEGAGVVIFGHSHVQLARTERGIWLVNPGSIPLPRGDSKPGYARLMVTAGEIGIELVQTA